MPNTEVFVQGEKGELKDRNAVGELVVRGSNIMIGYWNEPDETKKVLKPGRYPGEYLLYTGDLFRIDKEGFLYFEQRMDNIIKSRGERISPKEIENVIYQLKDIIAVRVFPIPDEIMGNAIKAEVVLRKKSDLSSDKIILHCRENLEDLKVPKSIDLVDSLPESDSGKIISKYTKTKKQYRN
jgi:acyl-CoA synthetase (AMP-forming)/AMP-acid ligase II